MYNYDPLILSISQEDSLLRRQIINIFANINLRTAESMPLIEQRQIIRNVGRSDCTISSSDSIIL